MFSVCLLVALIPSCIFVLLFVLQDLYISARFIVLMCVHLSVCQPLSHFQKKKLYVHLQLITILHLVCMYTTLSCLLLKNYEQKRLHVYCMYMYTHKNMHTETLVHEYAHTHTPVSPAAITITLQHSPTVSLFSKTTSKSSLQLEEEEDNPGHTIHWRTT